MSLTKKDIEEIMSLLDASRFDRLSLEMDGLKLELDRSSARRPLPTGNKPPAHGVQHAGAPSPSASPPDPQETTSSDTPATPPRRSAEEGLLEVKSPLLGVYYCAPKPGEPPFVEAGQRVTPDTVIGIIEVMKLMNSARAGVTGTIVEILATNGEMVEHNEVLMLVRPDS